MHPDEQETQQFSTQPNMAAQTGQAAAAGSQSQGQTPPPSIYDMIEGTWRQLDALAIHLYGMSPVHLRQAIVENRVLMTVYQQRADQLAAQDDTTLASVGNQGNQSAPGAKRR